MREAAGTFSFSCRCIHYHHFDDELNPKISDFQSNNQSYLLWTEFGKKVSDTKINKQNRNYSGLWYTKLVSREGLLSVTMVIVPLNLTLHILHYSDIFCTKLSWIFSQYSLLPDKKTWQWFENWVLSYQKW